MHTEHSNAFRMSVDYRFRLYSLHGVNNKMFRDAISQFGWAHRKKKRKRNEAQTKGHFSSRLSECESDGD